ARYNSVYSHAADEIRQSGLWDGVARQSYSDDGPLPHPSPYGPGAGYQHGRNMSKSSGLRNEVARGGDETVEDLMDPYAGGGGGGKLKKSHGGGGGGGGRAPANASSVVGYSDAYDEEAQYGRGAGGGRYDDPYAYGGGEGGFRPPEQSSEVPARRW
ncbi:hypothetical protein JCM6882_008096, partial [Rhodosporidiobolus microsporus]